LNFDQVSLNPPSFWSTDSNDSSSSSITISDLRVTATSFSHQSCPVSRHSNVLNILRLWLAFVFNLFHFDTLMVFQSCYRVRRPTNSSSTQNAMPCRTNLSTYLFNVNTSDLWLMLYFFSCLNVSQHLSCFFHLFSIF
jgi:hypothetical protein